MRSKVVPSVVYQSGAVGVLGVEIEPSVSREHIVESGEEIVVVAVVVVWCVRLGGCERAEEGLEHGGRTRGGENEGRVRLERLSTRVSHVLEHAELGLAPLHVDDVLRDAARGHLRLDVLEARLVVAYVVGHVAVRVDGE